MFSLFNNILKIFVKAFLKLDIPVYILLGFFFNIKKISDAIMFFGCPFIAQQPSLE